MSGELYKKYLQAYKFFLLRLLEMFILLSHFLLKILMDSHCYLPLWFLFVIAAGLWTSVLPKMHAATWSQLPNHMCVPSTQEPEGGEGYRVCSLWLQGLRKWWLINWYLLLSLDCLLLDVKYSITISVTIGWSCRLCYCKWFWYI